MANKYWWEEVEEQPTQQTKTQTQTQANTQNTEKKYWWDNVEQKSENQGYWWDEGNIANKVGNKLVNQVNNWLTNHNNYITSYNDRYTGRKYTYEDAYVSDSADWLNTVTTQKSQYDAEADSILAYLDEYSKYLDKEWVNQVKKTISDARGTQSSILENVTKDNEYWSLFKPNEDQKNAGYTADKVYSEWQAGQKQYADDMEYDVNAGMLELEALKKEKEAYLTEKEEQRKKAQSEETIWESIGRWLGTSPDTTLPLGGVSTSTGETTNTTKYDKQIAELEDRIERAKYVQGYEGYMANKSAEDYAANSQYNSTRTDVAMNDALWGFGTSTQYDQNKLFGDYLYDYINRNQDALDVATLNDTASNAYFMGLDKGFLQTMSDDEIGVYNYLYKTQGQEAANEYLSYIGGDLKGRRAAQEQAFWAAYAKENPVASSVFSTLISPLKGLSYLGQAADMLDDGKMEENAGYNRFSNIPTTIRSTVSTAIENSGKWGDVGSFAYNTGMSMADFLFSTAVSGGNQGLSLAIMGTGAAADATIAAKQRGLEDAEAFTLGTIAGAAEVAMEKISLGAWLDGDMSEGALRYILKNALSEGAEEAGTSVINLLADVIIAGDKSEWNMAMQAYIDEGKSPEEAFGLVAAEQAAQIGLDALGGALSGFAIGGGTYVGSSAVSGVQYKDYKNNAESVQGLVTESLQLDPNNQYAQKMQSKLEKGKNLTGMQIRNLLAANQEQITSNDMQKIQKAAEQRLTTLGQTQDVAKVAELATKWATGQDLTLAEKRMLTKSEYGSRVANELIPENIASGNYSTEWAEEIGTKNVNASAYNKKAIRTLLDAMAKAENPATYKSLEERAGTESSLSVSKSGQATIRETGEAVSLDKAEIVNIDSKDMTMTVDGKEVKASEIDFADDSQAYLFDAVSKIENITPAAATAIIRDYDSNSGLAVGEYLNGIDEGYTYGYYGYSEADLNAGIFAPKLSKEQMMSAYKLGQSARKISDTSKTEAIKRMRTAEEVAVSKNATTTQKKAENLTITYNEGGGKVGSIENAGKLDAKRAGAVEVAKVIHKMGLGTRIEFFSSYVNKDGVRVFLNDAGVEQSAYSGLYRLSDGTIRIDLEAYNGSGLTLNALSHELTHFIQQWSPEKYKVLADFLVESYEKTDMTMHERVLKEQARLERIRNEKVSYDEAYNEVVANAMSKMFDDGKLVEKLTELKAKDEKLARKLWEGFKKILAKFLGVYQNESALFKDAADLVKMKETFEQLQNMFAEALVDASDNLQASITATESQTLTEAGIGFDEDTKSVYSLHFSTAYKDVIKVGKQEFDTEAIAQIVAKGTGRSLADARKWVQSELTIANIVMANPEFLDFEADSRYEAIKKNSDYPQGTVDLSNLCPKREEFTAMFDRLQKKYPNKLFTAQDVADMRKILSDNDITVACGACFVEDRRQLIGEIADTFINMWKEAVDSGKPLQKTNAAGQKSDLLVTKALAKQYGLTAGTKIMATDTYIPNQYDLTTYEGFKLLEKNHPTIAMGFNRYNNSRGQQSARLIEGRAEYNRQILGWSDAKVRSVNNNGGLRIFSFSDFEVVHLLDLVQVIIDCAAKGVKIQGYTKIPAFAKLVRNTGVKLNRSLIPKGDYGYHMENGKVVLDYDTIEGIDINDKNFVDESDNPNVGNIVIGINPTQIGAAMLDPFVDYIIPFHSNKSKEILRKLGTGEWVNYKESQHEKDIATGTSSKHNVNIYTEVINKYHPTNKVEFVEAFLKECKRQGKIPRYAEFLNVDVNGDYAYREGYHKLLVDFKMFDSAGNILPQGNITPNLDEGFMTDLLKAEVDRKQNYKFPKKVYEAIDKKFGEQYSSHETDLDSAGNQLSKEQQEYFKDSLVRDANGNLKVVYHGSGSEFTVFSHAFMSMHGSMEGHGFYFTDKKSMAEGYQKNGTKLMTGYLDIKKPLSDSKVTLKRTELTKLLKAIDPTGDDVVINYDPMGGVGYPSRVWYNRALAATVDAIYNSSDSDSEILADLANSGAGTETVVKTAREVLGYDGYIVSDKYDAATVYVAFESNQFKNADNLTPTSNPDVRFSSHETDADYIRYDRTAILKESKVDEYLYDYAAKSSPKYAQAYIAYVRPRTFLKLTTDDVFERYHIADQAGELDAERLSNSRPGIYLRIDHETGQVTGHEGRHRMAAMESAGIELVPVLLVDTSNKMAKTDIAEIYLHGQFDETAMGIVKDLIPLNYENRDRVIKNFATQSSTQRMGERYGLNKTLRFSEHETDSYSNRHLLANAFEGITQNSNEYKLIQEYKGRIKLLNEYEAKLSDLNAEIRKITFGTEGVRDSQKLKQLQAEAKQVAEDINRNDKKLLSLEASEPLRKVIERERKKEIQKTKAHVKEIQDNKKYRAEQTELRHKIRKAIRDLDKVLNRGNKKLNVKEDMQDVVSTALKAADILFTDNYGTYDMLRNGIGTDMSDAEEALVKTCAQMLSNIDKMTADSYEGVLARQEAESRLRIKMSKLSEVFARERKRLNNTTVSSILGELADSYAKLNDSTMAYVQGAYSEPVYNFLKNLQSEVGGTIVKDMTKNQLEHVYAAYRMVLETVRNANKMFNAELKQSREQLGNAVIEEVINAGGVHLLGTKLGDTISQFDWNNLKPVWVGDRIGSETFGKLMNGLFKGQYNFAEDIDAVRRFKLEMDDKYKPRGWDAEKLYEFESSTGKKFSLNLQQIMSLYAFSKREQAYSHLLNGGFVFEENSTVIVEKNGIKRTYIHKGAASYKVNEATLNGIVNSLTVEQKAYVDDMQAYLSNVMGAKGNEVSMKLYGIEMFKEKFYFPLRSSGAYMEKAKEAEMKKQQGQINLVNSGFTHAVKPEAKNPIVLSGFMDVWAEHCNEMSMYHSMVLPMEDFRKVYNYTTVHDENMESASVYQTIQDAYGKAATSYIDQLYRELNAGATVDPRETPWKKLISNFKKSSVMLSASVWVQQFSSIGRAYAVIDPKHFIGAKVNSDTKLSAAEEMKKYAPVAIIKEMGGFDTGTKGNAKAYIMAEQYGKGERIQGLLKDEQYRGDLMGYLPAKADEKTWAAIWEAAKRETKANNPKMDVKSEEFLKLAGERFSEVIEKTQVYDSVLARSANMRSKGNFMSMATAFMAEPTTTVNLLENAIRSGNGKHIARAFSAVAVSIVLNNALASIVYAMRDDDEDETLLEKYFQSFTSGMIDDINPMSYYPFLKDVYSLFQGYDVERTDMSVIADVRDALKKAISLLGKDTSDMDDEELAAHYKQVNEVLMGVLDAGCSAFGVPVKNIRKDVGGIINAWNTIGTDLSGERDNSWNSFWDKVGEAAKDTVPILAWTKDKAKTDKLYTAIVSGDKAYLARLKSTYKTDSAYQTAVRKALRECDARIHDAAQAKVNGNTEEYKRIFRAIKDEGKFSFDDIMSAINSEESAIRNGSAPDKVTSSYAASDFVEAIVLGDQSNAQAVRNDIVATYMANGKTEDEAEDEFASDVATGISDAYASGLLNKAGAEKMLVEYAGKDEDEAASKVSYWAFREEHPEYKDILTEANVAKYHEFAEPADISVDVYAQFIKGTKGLTEIKDEWGDVEVTKREQVLEVIDSLDLTWEQKDALYLAAGYAESKIWDVPW